MGEQCGCDRCLMQELGRQRQQLGHGVTMAEATRRLAAAMSPPVDELERAVRDLSVPIEELVGLARDLAEREAY
jgi:hypothetical protein